jgi:SAM-dependent methyltransferase
LWPKSRHSRSEYTSTRSELHEVRGAADLPGDSGFAWPIPPGAIDAPAWTGQGFVVDGALHGVLSYSPGDSGWTDKLTAFHEDTAGSNHPIDRASRANALRQLAAHAVGKDRLSVLEVGCSSGFLLHMIRRRLPRALVIGADYVRGPLEALASESPDLPLLHFDLCHCPLPSDSIDAAILLNVLEHIDDDALALDAVFRILRPGGIAIFEVPAGPELFDVYDELLMHRRRYRMPQLRKLVQQSGFEVVKASHLGVLIYPPFFAVKQWNKRYRSRDRALQERVVADRIRGTGSNPFLYMVLRLEQAVGKLVDWPFGIRCLITARKPL